MPQLATALRKTLREGYGWAEFQRDLLAGWVVSVIALPLSMSLAIACGLPPQHGLYTAIFAGLLIPLLGGSAVNISGPTAAFVVLLAPLAHQYGLAGLLTASLLAGGMLIAMGLLRMGRWIRFVPHPVTSGFTAGTAVVIAALQLRDFFGISATPTGTHLPEQLMALVQGWRSARWEETLIGSLTLVVLLAWPRISRWLPGPVVGVALGALSAVLLRELWPQFQVATIGSRFGELDPWPSFEWPWLAQNGPGLSLAYLRELFQPAMAIAGLGAITSLLCSAVADGMAGTDHDPDNELIGQGIGNLLVPFVGGFAATAAIARTTTNVRVGGRSPLAAVAHSIWLFLSLVLLAPWLGYLPMSSLAALLLVIAWRMVDRRHLLNILRVAPRSDIAVLLTCFGLTVAIDMVVAVTVGVGLAAMLFLQRMSDLFQIDPHASRHPHLNLPQIQGVMTYEIAGPLFFGAAQKAIASLIPHARDQRVVILDMRAVPTMDITGLVALQSALATLEQRGTYVVLAGVRAQPRQLLEKAGVVEKAGVISLCEDADEAALMARLYLGIEDVGT